jgi:hypothetical protein
LANALVAGIRMFRAQLPVELLAHCFHGVAISVLRYRVSCRVEDAARKPA